MINIPFDIDATITDTGIDVHVWINDGESPSRHLSWPHLIGSLVEGYTIPSRGRKLSPIMNAGDYAYLCEVMTALREAAFMLEEQLDQVTLLED